MITLGSLDIITYEKLMRRLKDLSPEIQSDDCPFAIVRVINKHQAIAIQGSFKRQSYELNIFDIQHPGLDKKNIEVISNKDYEEATQKVNDILSDLLRK